jgi:hypothetical protein
MHRILRVGVTSAPDQRSSRKIHPLSESLVNPSWSFCRPLDLTNAYLEQLTLPHRRHFRRGLVKRVK